MKRLLRRFVTIISFAPIGIYAQVPLVENRQKQYLPVSPTSARLMAEIDYPVNYSTGSIDVTIPLYTIKTRDFTLPITLKCNTNGIKVGATPDWVGLGWTLQAEPTVTREIRGNLDEVNGYAMYNASFGSYDKLYLDMMHSFNSYDEKPDIFYFQTLSNSGKFVFKRPENTSESGKYKPIFFPASSEQIIITNLNNGLNIKDNKGNLYAYGNAGLSKETSWNGSFSGVTTWKATQITSVQNDIITFTYQTRPSGQMQDFTIHNDFYAVEDQSDSRDVYGDPAYPTTHPPDCGYWKGVSATMTYYKSAGTNLSAPFSPHTTQSYEISTPTVTPLYIKDIQYAGGRVEFIMSGDHLAQIKIYENNAVIQVIDLSYTNVTTDIASFKLQQVKITEHQGKEQIYSFNYFYDPSAPPVPGLSKSRDFWGYYNAANNSDLVPVQTIKINPPGPAPLGLEEFITIGGANREASLEPCQRNTLKEIIYPTGQRDLFTYELHEYEDLVTHVKKTAGGLRIKKVESYNKENELQKVRRFKYGFDGSGHIWTPPALNLYQQNHQKLYKKLFSRDTRRYRIFSSNPMMPLTNSAGVPVTYSRVVEEAGIFPDEVLTTVYNYNNYPNYSSTGTGVFMFAYNFMDEWQRYQFLGKSQYNRLTGNVVASQGNSYNYITIPETSPGSNKTRVGDVYSQMVVVILDSPNPPQIEDKFYYRNLYDIEGNKNYSLIQTNDTLFTEQGMLTTQRDVEYGTTEYDVRTAQPVETSTLNSDGSVTTQQFTYPYHSNSAVSQSMVMQNDISSPLEVKETKIKNGSTVAERKVVSSYELVSSGYLPYRLAALKTNNTVDGTLYDVEKYNKHDAQGNLTEYIKKDGTVVTLLWGYNYQKLIAEITGVNYDQVISLLGTGYASLQSMDNTSLQNLFNNLRTAVPGLVTSFTYYPTRGIAAMTDNMGKTSFYEYDGLGRLILVKDDKGNVLKKIDYQYVNQ